MKTISGWMEQLDEKRAIAIGVAGALCALSLDAAAGHFAGRPGVHPAQWLPVTLGPAASAMVLTFAIPNLDDARFRRAMMAIGGIVAAIGAIGTAFHLLSLLMLLDGHPLSMQAIETALAEGPPLFAPGGFLGLGALLAALGSTKLVVRFGLRRAGVTLTGLSATSLAAPFRAVRRDIFWHRRTREWRVEGSVPWHDPCPCGCEGRPTWYQTKEGERR